LTGKFRAFEMEPAMSTGGKNSRDIRVALIADLVANERSPFDIRRNHDGSVDRRAGNQQNRARRRPKEQP
jgi:hypothetical protein